MQRAAYSRKVKEGRAHVSARGVRGMLRCLRCLRCESAGVLFTDLLIQSRGNSANHSMFGAIMSKYLERMAKSNDQILRLAELIAKEDVRPVDVNDIFNKIIVLTSI